MTRARCSLALLALLSAPASAKVLWRADFESGDLSQWTRKQMVAPDRMTVVASPVREGRFALRTEVRQGDDPIGASGNRNELVYMGSTPEGAERWFKWSVLFPEDYPASAPYQVVVQWHHTGCCGVPPMLLNVVDDQLRLTLCEEGKGCTIPWSTPLERGRWLDFVLHVTWSSRPTVGFVEMWKDGVVVVPKTMAATLYPGQANYLKAGLYRKETIQPVGVVFHDDFMEATSREDVFPAPPPTAPAQDPAPGKSDPTPGDARGGDGPPAQQVESAREEGGCAQGGAGGVGLVLLAIGAARWRGRGRVVSRSGPAAARFPAPGSHRPS